MAPHATSTRDATTLPESSLETAERSESGLWLGPEDSLFRCLILSPSTGRREIFGAAAAGSGWRVLVTGDVTLAQDSLNQYVVQLGIVDLVGVEASTYRGLLERLANPAQVLLVVCGNEGNVREEIWVRQQGAWLYLTGVKDGACISAVCQEARDIIDRLRQVSDAGRPARSCK